MKQLLLAVSGLLLAAGCATKQTEVVGQEYLARRALAAANSKQCMDQVKRANPVYERLSDLFIYDLSDNRQLTKMSNRNYVTAQNVADLIRFREMIQSCYDQSLADYGNADRRYAEYMLSVRASSDNNLLELLNRQITIGERNVYLLEALHGNRSRFTEIDREVIADLNRASYFSVGNGRREVGALEEIFTYPAVTLPPRPTPDAATESVRPATAPDSRSGTARCRFEGSSIRCD